MRCKTSVGVASLFCKWCNGMSFWCWLSLLFSDIRWSIVSSSGIFSAVTQVSLMLAALPAAASEPLDQVEAPSTDVFQVTSVSQLADVQPTAWVFLALQSLVERYGCIAGYSESLSGTLREQTFRGSHTLTRYEFAAGLNTCLERVSELLATKTQSLVSREDLAVFQRLQEEFAAELATLRGRVETLETRTAGLEARQFSTTTKLTGQVIAAVTGGSFSGDRILAPTGAIVAERDPNTTVIYRTSLFFSTSFQGTDQLQVRLTAGSEGANDNAAGFLEPNFGSVLDFSVPGRPQFALGRLFYTFTPIRDVTVTLGPQIVATDYVDRNRYANTSFLDFSTQALINNFPLFPRSVGAGAVLDWHPERSAFKLRAVYVAGNAASFNTNGQRYIEGPQAPALLFPNRGGSNGLFGDPYLGIVELEYAPSRAFTLRLQYSGGKFLESRFDVFGANVEVSLSKQVALFGRYGNGTYLNTTVGNLNPQYWMAGVAFRDLFMPGALAGIAVGQPLIESNVGNATQTNFEAFYNLPLNENIRITPLVQVITDAGNQGSNGPIITGTIRTVFSF